MVICCLFAASLSVATLKPKPKQNVKKIRKCPGLIFFCSFIKMPLVGICEKTVKF